MAEIEMTEASRERLQNKKDIGSLRTMYIGGLLVLLCLLSACSNIKEYYYFFQGNHSHTTGDYPEALRHYLRISENPYVTYNLGLVYVALGESESAHLAWHIAESSTNASLAARAFFNNGVLYYQEADFAQAYSSFKEALRRNPKDIDTKRYLELSYQRISGSDRVQETQTKVFQETKEYARVLDYIQRVETSYFVKNSNQGEIEIHDW